MTQPNAKSDEEHDQSPDRIFDFIYRDPQRIASLCAQLFDGQLASFQRRTGVLGGKRSQVKGGVGIASAEVDSTQSHSQERTEVFNPHDAILLDLLRTLQTDEWLKNDFSTAANGQIVIAKGNVFFADKYVLSLADVLIELAAQEAKKKGAAGRAEVKMMEMMRKILPKFDLPGAFFLRCASGEVCAGTIKEAGLDEPIPAYYFKNGGGGLSDVHVLGILEEETAPPDSGSEGFLNMMQQVATGLRGMIFPPDSLRVTPVLMFRVLSRQQAISETV